MLSTYAILSLPFQVIIMLKETVLISVINSTRLSDTKVCYSLWYVTTHHLVFQHASFPYFFLSCSLISLKTSTLPHPRALTSFIFG